jgi:hypothetical protein
MLHSLVALNLTRAFCKVWLGFINLFATSFFLGDIVNKKGKPEELAKGKPCRYCGRWFDDIQQCLNHEIFCPQNPNHT